MKEPIGTIKGRRSRVNLEMSFTFERKVGYRARRVSVYLTYNLRRRSRRGRGRRRMHRIVGHAQLRRAVGTEPPADRARSLRRSYMPRQGANSAPISGRSR